MSDYNDPIITLAGSPLELARRLIALETGGTAPVNPLATTVEDVPDAAEYEGQVIYVSDGDDGDPCLAVSNGTDWLRVVLGAAVAEAP